jgi:glycosyltransferase involved in cell wall biosynthesis
MNASYSIVIPAYNEEQRLPATLDKVLAHAAQQHWRAEIIVVNDGSRDRTAEVARSYAQRNPTVRLVNNPGNRGKGYSVRNGMLNAHGDLLLFTDADLSSPISEAAKLFQAIEAGADVAIGSRWLRSELQTQHQPRYRELFGRLFNLLLRLILGLKYKDTQCGFKAFTRPAARLLFSAQRVQRWAFDPELLFLANKFELKVREVPVEWAHDQESRISPVKDGIKMFGEILSVRWADLRGKYRPTLAAVPAAR